MTRFAGFREAVPRTDVEYEITVTDTEMDAERVYTNPRGRIESRADVEVS